MPVTDVTKDVDNRTIVITAEFAAPHERFGPSSRPPPADRPGRVSVGIGRPAADVPQPETSWRLLVGIRRRRLEESQPKNFCENS